jgi:hypothetical protein
MSVRKVGTRLWIDTSANGKRWRGPIDAYTAPRQNDAAWRAQCRLPEGASLTVKRILERHVEPQAALDWQTFTLGEGPDPRLPPPRSMSSLLARDLIQQWYDARVNDPVKPLTSTYSTGPRVEFLKRWLGERPATDLLKQELYGELTAHVRSRGSSRYTGTHYSRPRSPRLRTGFPRHSMRERWQRGPHVPPSASARALLATCPPNFRP